MKTSKNKYKAHGGKKTQDTHRAKDESALLEDSGVTPSNYGKGGKNLPPRVLLPIKTSFKMKAKKTFSKKYNQRISHL